MPRKKKEENQEAVQETVQEIVQPTEPMSPIIPEMEEAEELETIRVDATPIKDSNDPIEMAQVAHPVLSEVDQKSGDKRYYDKVQSFLSKDKMTLLDILKLHWEKGKFVDELFRNPGHYGNHTAEQFAKDIGGVVESVYRYRLFYLRYNEAELRQAAEQRISWHNLSYLIGVEDKVKRLSLQQQIADRKITAADLQQKVKETNKTAREKGKKDNRGTVSSLVVFKSIASLCNDLINRIAEYQDAMEEFRDMEDGERKVKVALAHKNALNSLKKVEDRIVHLHD